MQAICVKFIVGEVFEIVPLYSSQCNGEDDDGDGLEQFKAQNILNVLVPISSEFHELEGAIG